MDDHYTPVISEEERAARRAERAAARKEKLRLRRRRQLKRLLPVLAACLALVGVLAAWSSRSRQTEETRKKSAPEFIPVRAVAADAPPYSAAETEATIHLGEEFSSSYAVLIDLASGNILAEKASQTAISPASMTKILTLLVAAEHLTDDALDDTVTISIDITDYCYVNKCSVVGLDVGETVSVRELLYGTILPSGADAALGLAAYVSGSQEAFVELMNEKLTELGLSGSAHFTNCVGLYDENHLCTVYDMAMILKAAMDNPLCREVLSAHTYQTVPTAQHPEGQVLSNWFLRKIEDHVPDGFEVMGAKTGYVVQSGNCAASWGENVQGHEYLCVTGMAHSSWRAIFDHVELYKTYCQ
jgi:D-alanyl-D-alanine carboxypeptidase (penicillin-binding protein 5/6)